MTGVHPVVVWSASVVAGLGVGRLDLTSVRVRVGLVLVGLLLAGVGSMPLTAYCAQLVGIASIADTVIGAADDGVGHILWFSGTTLVACTLRAVLVGRGPLERLLGALTRRVARG